MAVIKLRELSLKVNPLTLIWVGFLGVHFEVEGGEGKITPSFLPTQTHTV